MVFSKKENNLRQSIFLVLSSSSWIVPLVYLAWITLAEVFTTLINPPVGIALHGIALIALILHGALNGKHLSGNFLLTLSIIPLIRLLNLAMPLQPFQQIYWYMIVGIPLFAASFTIARIGKINRKMIGLTGKKLLLQVLIGLSGIGLGYLEYKILHPRALVAYFSLATIWLPAIILLIFTGLLEEIIFRGLLQYNAERVLGKVGIIYSSLVFTVLHLGYRSIIDLAFVFGVAMFFALIVRRSGSIWGVTLAHGLINITIFLVFPFFLPLK